MIKTTLIQKATLVLTDCSFQNIQLTKSYKWESLQFVHNKLMKLIWMHENVIVSVKVTNFYDLSKVFVLV